MKKKSLFELDNPPGPALVVNAQGALPIDLILYSVEHLDPRHPKIKMK